jgi:hypothetical protein
MIIIIGLIITYYSIPKIISYYIYTHVRMHISIIWYIYIMYISIYTYMTISNIYIYTHWILYIYAIHCNTACVYIYIYIMCKHVPLCQSNSEGGLLSWKTSMAMNLYILPVPPTWQWKSPCGRGTLFTHDNHDGFALILAMPPSKKNIWVLGLSFVLRVVDDRCLKNHTIML